MLNFFSKLVGSGNAEEKKETNSETKSQTKIVSKTESPSNENKNESFGNENEIMKVKNKAENEVEKIKKVKVGLIGIGQRLTFLVEIFFQQHPNLLEIVAIADENKEAINYYKKNRLDLISINLIEIIC